MRSGKVMTLLEDIVKYVKKKIIRCIALFIILECATILITVLTWNYFAEKTPLLFHITLIVLINMVPFFISKFPKNLIDKSWSGEIIAVNIETKSDAFSAGGKTHSYTKHQIMLDVKKENGKIEKIKIKEVGEHNTVITKQLGYAVPNQGDIKAFTNYYSEGDKIYHFYGLKYYYVDKKNVDRSDCVVCGCENKKDRETCISCGYSIIKNI